MKQSLTERSRVRVASVVSVGNEDKKAADWMIWRGQKKARLRAKPGLKNNIKLEKR
jgi:hypothetical protein